MAATGGFDADDDDDGMVFNCLAEGFLYFQLSHSLIVSNVTAFKPAFVVELVSKAIPRIYPDG